MRNEWTWWMHFKSRPWQKGNMFSLSISSLPSSWNADMAVSHPELSQWGHVLEVTWEQDGSPVLSIPPFQVWTTNPQCYMREKEPLCCFKPLNLVVIYYYTTVCPKNTVNNYFQSRSDTLSHSTTSCRTKPYQTIMAYCRLDITGWQ